MIVDSSALVAILREEPDAVFYAEALERHGAVRLASPNFVETAIVIEAQMGMEGGKNLDHLLERTAMEVVACTREHAELARAAYRMYGRGSGHPARLNFGDCFAYALAKAMREPLLYKGSDFAHTDVRSALPRR